nr:MAG TPA: hypothetical protein [Caudoviricetes sp.]
MIKNHITIIFFTIYVILFIFLIKLQEMLRGNRNES